MKPIVDLLFIVDVTSSMGGLIQSAKANMRSMLEKVNKDNIVDLKVGFSFYRDHPPQDTSFVTAVFDLVDSDKAQEYINQATIDGGGDYPEAVLDGIIDGVEGLSWRKGSKRIAFLIGDAAPQGMDHYGDCCLCGKTWGDAVAVAESNKVIVYSIVLGGNRDTRDTFKTLSTFTGGIQIDSSSDKAMDAIANTLKSDIEDLNLDTRVLDLMARDKSKEEICEMLNIDRDKLNKSSSRLAEHA